MAGLMPLLLRLAGADRAALARQGHMERWFHSLRRECLDHFVPGGLGHLDHLVSEYLEHYHNERPHQGLGNLPLGGCGPPRESGGSGGEVVCRARLGGVLRHYERKAA